MSPGGAGGAGGLAASLRQLVASALELAQVRLELIGTELEAQKLRIASGLMWAALAVVLFALALVLVVVCVMIVFWDAYRLQAAIVMLLLFVGGGALAWRHAGSRLRTPPGAFAASADELRRDLDALRAADAAAPRQPS